MKKLITLAFLFCGLVNSMLAQTEVVGSEEYGRIFDVTYHPAVANTLYAITLGNHIVTSTDNGASWDVFYSFPEQATTIEGLRFAGDNQLSFYVRFSLINNSVYVLDINSLEISKEYNLPVPPNSTRNWVSKYAIFQEDTDVAIVLQGYQIGLDNFAKVYYTNDGGNAWQEIYHNIDYDVFPNNVAIHPENAEHVFIARGNGPGSVDGGLFISTDAGTTWEEKLPGNTFDAIAFHPANSSEMLLGTSIGFGTHDQNLYKSSDTGATWQIIPIDWTDQTLNSINVIAYNPQNPDQIIILEENEIVTTDDNFATWQNHVYLENDVHSYYYGLQASYNPFASNEIFISSNYHALFSEDGGETVSWSKNPYFSSTGNINLFSNQGQEHLYYGVQFGYVHRDLSNQEEAPYEVLPLDTFGNSLGIATITDNHIAGRIYSFSGGFMGSSLFVSDNHGENKEQIYSIFSNNVHSVVSNPDNASIVWASFSNFGENPEVVEIDFTDLNNIQSNTITLPVQDIVTGIHVDTENSNHRLLAIGTWIYKTTDGGATWQDFSNGLEDLVAFNDLILHLEQNPLNAEQFTIATNKGVYTSMDGGENWTQLNNFLTHNVKHSTGTDGHIVAFTHNSNTSTFKIRYTANGGNTWSEVADEDIHFVASNATEAAFTKENADVYIGTYDLGLVKHTIDFSLLGVPNTNVNPNWLTVYPNPVQDNLNLKMGNEEIESISVFSISGQTAGTFTNKSINVSSLKSGVYFIQVITKSGKKETQKFIKK